MITATTKLRIKSTPTTKLQQLPQLPQQQQPSQLELADNSHQIRKVSNLIQLSFLTNIFKAKRLSSVDRNRKQKIQDDVDKNVVINNMQEKLPGITKQKNVETNTTPPEQRALTAKKEEVEPEENCVNGNDEASESLASEDSNNNTIERFEINNATPDLVPKSFQDKR